MDRMEVFKDKGFRMRNKINLTFRWSLVFSVMYLLTGCSLHNKNIHKSSSVVHYLYPNKQKKIEPQIPSLRLPLRVGIAFVPEFDKVLTEETKLRLLQNVASKFKKYNFVDSIEIIPSAYLKKEGSFSNLTQLSTMYNVDVMALVAYDQQQFTDDSALSLLYWTIVGAYLIPASKNDTHTMMDVSIFDIKSRKMLFRAPGMSHIEGNTTPVGLSAKLRKDSVLGFENASKQLITNLDNALKRFREKVKQSPKEYKVTHRTGYTGGGSIDIFFFLILLLSTGMILKERKKV